MTSWDENVLFIQVNHLGLHFILLYAHLQYW